MAGHVPGSPYSALTPCIQGEDSQDDLLEGVKTSNLSCTSIACATITGIAAVALVALRVFGERLSWPDTFLVNTLLMGGAGTSASFCIRQIPSIADKVSDLVADLTPSLFFALNQIDSVFPSARKSAIIEGCLSFLLGMQVAPFKDLLCNIYSKNNREIDLSRSNSSKHITLLLGNNRLERMAIAVSKFVVGVVLVVVGFTADPNRFKEGGLLLECGWVFLGMGSGWIVSECIYALRNSFEKTLKIIQMAVLTLSDLLPGVLIGLKFPLVALFAGLCLGIKRTDDVIKLTSTPIFEMSELQEGKNAEIRRLLPRLKHIFCQRSSLRGQLLRETLFDLFRWTFGPFSIVGAIIYNCVKGGLFGRVVYLCAGAVLIISYIFSRLVNHQKIYGNIRSLDGRTPPLLASAYFYTHASPLAPIVFLIVHKWMQTEGVARGISPTVDRVLGAVAWSDLTWSLGSHLAVRESERNRPYPAPMHPVGAALLTNWLVTKLSP